LAKEEQNIGTIADPIPASMLAAFAYCPRLCYIQWVQGEFQDNAEIVDGRLQHRWVDAEQDAIPKDFQPFHARSVSLTAPQAGVCCRIDLLEGNGKLVTPVEYKRGVAPKTPAGPYEPYQIQLCAQALALRENGFQCDEGMVYFVRSKERVAVKFDPEMVGRTMKLIEDLRRTAEKGEMPPPLRSCSRCNRCSLAGICLPDEVNLLREMRQRTSRKKRPECCFQPEMISCPFTLSARGTLYESAASGWRFGHTKKAKCARPG
jgi:CRISP-associated protein Cas1